MRAYLDDQQLAGDPVHLIANRTELCVHGQWYLYTGCDSGVLHFTSLIGGGDLEVPERTVREAGGAISVLGLRQRPV
jgi:hypothetical protein